MKLDQRSPFCVEQPTLLIKMAFGHNSLGGIGDSGGVQSQRDS